MVVPPMLAIVLGAGLITPAVTAALMTTVEKSRAGIAAGVLNSARQTGAALGVAIFGPLPGALHPFEVGTRCAVDSRCLNACGYAGLVVCRSKKGTTLLNLLGTMSHKCQPRFNL
jgi:MFS family permease